MFTRTSPLLLAALIGAVVAYFGSGTAGAQDKKTSDDAKKVADKADQIQKGVLNQKANDDYIKENKEKGYLAIQIEQEKAAIPPGSEREFPRNWDTLTKKRQQMNMTEREKKIMKALETPMDLELKDSTLEAVISYIKEKSGVNIVVPPALLEEKGITYQTPVSVSLKKVTMRTALKKVLSDVGMVYVIDKEVILATTEERARDMLTTRTYYVGDLIGLTGSGLGGLNSKAATLTAINDIIGVIVGTIEPDSWWIKGGNGTIAFNPGTMSFVVKQTAEVHFRFGMLR
jgi:hypothetical protein